jgi:hypothetical protein
MGSDSHYDVLGVDATADRETIRRAYIVLAKDAHPDRNATNESRRDLAADTIRRANEAWSVLGNPDRRAAYDLRMRVPARSSTPSTPYAPAPTPAFRTGQSGVMVSTRTAPLWKWGPIVAMVILLGGILVVSAYSTSRDTTKAEPVPSSVPLAAGQCVFVVFTDSGRAATPTPCTGESSGRVDSIIETPRPCGPGTQSVELYDGKTTLCLVTGR